MVGHIAASEVAHAVNEARLGQPVHARICTLPCTPIRQWYNDSRVVLREEVAQRLNIRLGGHRRGVLSYHFFKTRMQRANRALISS